MTSTTITAQIQLHELTKSFRTPRGEVHAVRGIDVTIDPGETVALLGPNGAGKSTTIDMLLGLTAPDAGTVSVLGRAPREAVDQGLVGAMLQTGGALIRDLSVRELVAMMASLYPAPLDVDEVLELTGIADIADRRTQKLSGGQTQRVRFAVALVSDPELLVLDEPVAMDVEGRRSFWTAMRAFAARGKTVLFATHYLEEADAYADRAVLMSHGRVVADGPTTEIKARVGLRTIRATLELAGLDALRSLPGVATAERHGEAVLLRCGDSDAAIRALLRDFPATRDIEIASAGLEEAFVQLTGGADEEATS